MPYLMPYCAVREAPSITHSRLVMIHLLSSTGPAHAKAAAPGVSFLKAGSLASASRACSNVMYSLVGYTCNRDHQKLWRLLQ